MTVGLNVPAPRNTYIGRVEASGRVAIDRDWLIFFTQTIPALFGGTGNVATLPEVQALADQAERDALAAMDAADGAMSDSIRTRAILDQDRRAVAEIPVELINAMLARLASLERKVRNIEGEIL